jgi:hypothetical protein
MLRATEETRIRIVILITSNKIRSYSHLLTFTLVIPLFKYSPSEIELRGDRSWRWERRWIHNNAMATTTRSRIRSDKTLTEALDALFSSPSPRIPLLYLMSPLGRSRSSSSSEMIVMVITGRREGRQFMVTFGRLRQNAKSSYQSAVVVNDVW